MQPNQQRNNSYDLYIAVQMLNYFLKYVSTS